MLYLTPRQAAMRMNVSISTVYRLLADGRLGHTRLSPRLVRIPVAALDALWQSAPAPTPRAGNATTSSLPSAGGESSSAAPQAPPLPKREPGRKRLGAKRSIPTHSDGSRKFY